MNNISRKDKLNKRHINRAERCCRPIIYNNGTGDLIDTWRGGTCFIIKWSYGLRKRYFIITALHVISNRLTKTIDADSLDKIRILKRRITRNREKLTDQDWVSVIAYHPIQNVEDYIAIYDDEDVSDVAIFEADSNAFDGDTDVFKIDVRKIGLDDIHVEKEINIRKCFLFLITGYPEAFNTIDYEKEGIVLDQRSLICERANINDNGALTEVRVTNPKPVLFPINGFSGSPVFSAYDGVTKLCGMVVRGGGPGNNIIRFLRISAIIPLIFITAVNSEKIMMKEFKRRKRKYRKIK
ncbi:hypothetical protein HKD28_12510 [Gluconobacter sp. LMG 1744]|uniref:hypothetical protein n=1 Tax=Gluconobacter cadivus TaxID=2728101 RepID=UPI0018859871|nr:hypothetical protein [Gluconobacter cadivus]MBF0892223.1 hypothetical protein [Gluconobacter cadivus]